MISFICGQLCSGKTLYSTALAKTCDGVYIEVGDLVRAFKNSADRSVLQDSKELYTKIITAIDVMAKFHSVSEKDVVVSGVRQKEILEAFPDATLLWIECSAKIRKERYLYRSREGDNLTFEEAERGDIDLGILEVKKYIFERQ